MFAETQETLTKAQQSQLQWMMTVYNTTTNFFEKWQKVQIDMCRNWLQGSQSRMQKASSVKEMSEVSSLQSEAFQSAVSQLVSAAQEGHHLSQQVRGELTDAARQQIDQVNVALTQALDNAKNLAPSGSADALIAVCKQVLSMGNNFYEAMFHLGKQLSEMSDAAFNNTSQASACIAQVTAADCCTGDQRPQHNHAPQAQQASNKKK